MDQNEEFKFEIQLKFYEPVIKSLENNTLTVLANRSEGITLEIINVAIKKRFGDYIGFKVILNDNQIKSYKRSSQSDKNEKINKEKIQFIEITMDVDFIENLQQNSQETFKLKEEVKQIKQEQEIHSNQINSLVEKIEKMEQNYKVQQQYFIQNKQESVQKLKKAIDDQAKTFQTIVEDIILSQNGTQN